MVPVNLVSLAATLVVLWIAFRRDLPAAYPVDALERPAVAIRDPLVFRAAFPLLGLLLLAYFVTAPFGVPVSAVTCAGAVSLLLLARGRDHLDPQGADRRAVADRAVQPRMYLVVYGLRNAGLTGRVWRRGWLAGRAGPWFATIGTGFAAAILSSVMTTCRSVLIGALSIQQAPTCRR